MPERWVTALFNVGWGKVKIRAAHEVSEGKVFMGSKKRLARFHFATWLELRRGEASCHRELEVGDTGGNRMVCCSSEKRTVVAAAGTTEVVGVAASGRGERSS